MSEVAEFVRAIDEDEIEVHLQPVVDLTADGQVTSVEALPRWRHPTLGLLSPGAFLPLVLGSGLVDLLTDRVLRRGLTAVADWRGQGADVRLRVNVEPSQLSALGIGALLSTVASCGASPTWLTVEVTEAAFAVADPGGEAIDELRAEGVHLSLDDFSARESSLHRLAHLELDDVKLDRSLLAAACTSQRGQVIVAGIARLAHELGLRVVAEGLESQDMIDLARTAGCDDGQGFGIHPPAPADVVTAVVVDPRPGATA